METRACSERERKGEGLPVVSSQEAHYPGEHIEKIKISGSSSL